MMFCGFARWSEGQEETNVALTYESSKHLKELFDEYDCEYTEAWWPPSESELEEEEEEQEDEEVEAAESRSQEG
jgi:cyclopropane fatty-acyl-phospholipid synthase-like methyltransferase